MEARKPALLDQLEPLLQNAVGRQMVADVPVGILLSGGVDSSLLTAMAVRSSHKVKTFTIRFPGYGAYDETEHARLVARHFGTEHVELEAADSSVDLLPMLAKQFDEPLVDSSIIPTWLVSSLVRQHCTVALGGDGGDELFGGYGTYTTVLGLQQRLSRFPRFLGRLLGTAAETLLPLGLPGRNHLRSFALSKGSGLLPFGLFDLTARKALLSGHKNWNFSAEAHRKALAPLDQDLVSQMTRYDFAQYLPEDILVKVDRASMLASLEIRAPFLDHRLVEFAFGQVPTGLKTQINQRKIMLKALAQRVLPQGFDLVRKQGFSIPLASWLENPSYRDFFSATLNESQGSIFNRRYVQSILDGQAKGRSNSERLFALVMFELWRKEYGLSL
jgi:asparagine synthase (glutamine-hydrolysing)